MLGRLNPMQPVWRLIKIEDGPAAVEDAVMLIPIIVARAVAIPVIAN